MHPSDRDFSELAKLVQSDIAGRRDLEWKISLGLWGSVAAVTFAALRDEHFRDTIVKYRPGALAALVIAALVHTGIVFLLHLENSGDRQLYDWYRKMLEGATCKRPWPVEATPSWKKQLHGTRGHSWAWFFHHVVVTVVLFYAAWKVVLHS